MQILHQALKDILGKLPEQLFEQMLSQKLKAYGVKLSRSEYRQLQNYILSDEPKTLHLRRWRWLERGNVVVEFTEKEAQELEQRFTKIVGHLPQLIKEITRDSARHTHDAQARLARRTTSAEKRGFGFRTTSFPPVGKDVNVTEDAPNHCTRVRHECQSRASRVVSALTILG
jgi:hypothetical protein